MKEHPLAIVISALIKDNKILLLERIKGDYIGLLGLPGGKIEKNERVSDAAVGEILEESGIKSEFKNHLGFVSEHLIEGDNILQHFLLHVCELEPKHTKIKNESEGKLEWFELDYLDKMKEKIIPSDYLIIEKIIKNKNGSYYNCIMEKIGNKYELVKFE